MAILELRDVRFGYGTGKAYKEVIAGFSYSFETGKVYAIVGKSGAGKSTLLSLLSASVMPSSGNVLFEEKPTGMIDPLWFRRHCVAVIYQDYGLFPLLNVTENVLYPMELCGVEKKEAKRIASELLTKVGLSESLWDRYPSAISGGEQQRVAIARGLTMNRRLLLADEPTGNLDRANSEQILSLLLTEAHTDGRCVIMVTHDPLAAECADCVLRLEDGLLQKM